MFTNDFSQHQEKIKQDIQKWAIEWVEVPNEFYGYKFPVCPYARRARMDGEVDIQVYTKGSIHNFVQEHVQQLVTEKKFKVQLLALPPRIRYYPRFRYFLKKLNQDFLVPNGMFALLGSALTSQSRYTGLLNSGPYALIGINTLEMVLPAVESLEKAGYYSYWSQKHYRELVEYRQHMCDKFLK